MLKKTKDLNFNFKKYQKGLNMNHKKLYIINIILCNTKKSLRKSILQAPKANLSKF